MNSSSKIKKFFLKNSAVKVIVLILVVGYNCILGYNVINKISESRDLDSKKEMYLAKADSSLASSTSKLSGSDVYKTLAFMKTITNIESIDKLDDSSSRKALGSVKLDELKSLKENCVIEFCIEVNDVPSSLIYLKQQNLAYDYVSVDFSKITCRVLIKGGGN